jgi:hypothetical protein
VSYCGSSYKIEAEFQVSRWICLKFANQKKFERPKKLNPKISTVTGVKIETPQTKSLKYPQTREWALKFI